MTAIQVTWLREVRAFRGAFSCGVPVTAFLAVCGWMFVMLLRRNEGSALQIQSIWGLSIAPWLPILSAVLTMRLFAEEKRSGTIELLLTSPLRDFEIVLGKWLAAMVLYWSLLVISLFDFAILLFMSSPDWKPILVGYLGLLLQGGAMISLGIFLSSTTRNQIVAVAVTFFASLGLWVAEAVSVFNTAAWARAVGYLSILSHYEPFARGLIQSKDVIFFATFTFFWLFLTVRSLESLRWRA